jgi:hypothetical protein
MKKTLLIAAAFFYFSIGILHASTCQDIMNLDRAQASDPKLQQMKDIALNSTDFHERASAGSAVLAAFHIPESAQGLVLCRVLIASRSAWCRWWGYVLMGYLDMAQVRDDSSKRDLVNGLKDPEGGVRMGVVQSMGIFSDEDLIGLLCKAFTTDADPRVRERAACVLAHTGIYTKERRLKLVPFFIDHLKDPRSDEQTKNWSVQALQYITGANYGRDVSGWAAWEKKP